MPARKVYLEDLPLKEAQRRFEAALAAAGLPRRTEAVEVALAAALGRVTAAPVWARISSPHYHAAAMDGVAVRAADTNGASETSPVVLRIGEPARWVDTGDPLPEGCDAVIMIEDVQKLNGERFEIRAAAAPWQHVRPLGEDIVATELVLPEGHRLRPADLAAVAACGHAMVAVRRRPRVAIIPTGSELVPPGGAPRAGDIIEFNSLLLGGQVEECGGAPDRRPIVADEFPRIRAEVEACLEMADLVIVNAGSSAGSEDYTAQVFADLGTVAVHGAAIRPGHPIVLGVAREKPVVGIPGYPVSAALTFELFVAPLLARMLGVAPAEPPVVEAVMTRKVLSPMGMDEWVRVKLGRVGERLVATPLQRGAGVVMSLVRADGVVRIPRFSEGVHAGAPVEVSLLRPKAEIERTLVAIGSHDLLLDLLANYLHRRHPDRYLSSSAVGSLGGLLALKRGEAHLAGTHLLDEETGEYNLPFVRRLLPDTPCVVLNLAYREQGLLVAPGNPRGIGSLEDLFRPEVTFINRQRGSGTRILLDYKLGQLGRDGGSIRGYEREEFTHLAVAAAVASGGADVGLGILAAARALGLDFIPVLQERYDLVIPLAFHESPLLQPLLALLQDGEFRSAVEALGGYDLRDIGRVLAEHRPVAAG
jgi:putative molybdopterin biosynthesis protein